MEPSILASSRWVSSLIVVIVGCAIMTYLAELGHLSRDSFIGLALVAIVFLIVGPTIGNYYVTSPRRAVIAIIYLLVVGIIGNNFDSSSQLSSALSS